MDDLNSIYHSTQVAMAATEDDGDELELASPAQRIVAWLINRVIEIALLIPIIGVVIALLWQTRGSSDPSLLMTSMMGSLGLVGLLYLIYAGVQVYLMSKYGQSRFPSRCCLHACADRLSSAHPPRSALMS